MKSTVNEEKFTEKSIPPSSLLKHPESGLIIMTMPYEPLGEDMVCGVVINQGTENFIVGSYFNNWQIKSFQKFTGTITLENSA